MGERETPAWIHDLGGTSPRQGGLVERLYGPAPAPGTTVRLGPSARAMVDGVKVWTGDEETCRALAAAIFRYGEAQFECGEWRTDDDDETYDVVADRAETARLEVERLLGWKIDQEGSTMTEAARAAKETVVGNAAEWAAKGTGYAAWRRERPSFVTDALDFGGQEIGPREVAWVVAKDGQALVQLKGGLALNAEGLAKLRAWLDSIGL